jgi:DNA polymerase
MGSKVLPTYHPAYLLRNPEKKRDVWEDMKNLMKIMGV